MKRFCFWTISLGILTAGLTACSSNEHEALHENAAFSVVSAIQGNTRAPQLDASGAGSFVQGDVNTLFFQNGSGALEKTFSYTYGNNYYWYDLELRQPIDGLKVSACYPPVNAPTPQTFSWDVTSTQILTPDFLAAAATPLQQNVTSQVNLKFKHLMHRFAVKLVADGSTVTQTSLTTATLTLSQWKPAATINLLTAEVLGTTGSPALKTITGDQAAFIIPPQSVGDAQLKVQVDNRSQTFKLSEIKVGSTPVSQLESGKTLTLTIQVSKGAFVITGQSINGWGNQGEADGEIIL